MRPAAPMRIHLLLAATAWSAVGLGLLTAGARWTVRAGTRGMPMWLAMAATIGVLKAVFVLRRAAARVVTRIEAHGDGRCIGGFFSWRTWLLVILMSVTGRMLRIIGLPLAITGLIYVAVGSALLVASGWLWRAWSRHQGAPGSRRRPRSARQ